MKPCDAHTDGSFFLFFMHFHKLACSKTEQARAARRAYSEQQRAQARTSY
jgi:hypothetical protein